MAPEDPPIASNDLPSPPEAQPEPPREGRRLYRFSVRHYLRCLDLGILTDVRLELVRGLFVRQLGRGSRHNFPLIALPEALRALVPAPWMVVAGAAIRLGRYSRPDPAIAVISGPASNYRDRDPRAQETALVVEVAGVQPGVRPGSSSDATRRLGCRSTGSST